MYRLRTIAFTALLAGAASACGTGGADVGLDLIAHSADRASEVGTARFAMTMEISGPGIPEGTAVTGTGAYDDVEQTAQFTMQVSGGVLGEGGGDLSFDIVVAGTVVYMSLGSLGEAGFATPWVSFDLSTVDGFADLLGSTNPMGADPSHSLAFLRGAGDVEEVGREVVRGVATTHYRARADLADALADLPAAQRDLLEPQFETLRDVGIDELPIEAWIDAEGLPRRMRTTMDFAEGGADMTAGSAMSMEIDFFDFGEPVSITLPPADQVTELSE